VYKHPGGGWAIRYFCAGGCKSAHKQKVGPIKSEAIRLYHRRRNRAKSEPGWCPVVEARNEHQRAQAEQARERGRVLFKEYAPLYGEYSKAHKRSWRTDIGRITVLVKAFGTKKLDEMTSLEIEQFRDATAEKHSKATANRYRDLLSAIFKRAVRDGHVTVNPVRAVSKFRENNERVSYLTPQEEEAVYKALPAQFRPHFLISIHTGLRWTEQMNLRWQDIDLLTDFITVAVSKHGRSRRVAINPTARAVLVDLSSQRARVDDSTEFIFTIRPRESKAFFPQTVERAKAALKQAGQDAPHLDAYVWHSNRHTFASKLAMSGADLLTIKELGGWRTLSMVQRYAHLAPGHLHAAVALLVDASGAELARN
jgi:site-specific recombinase XerD